MKNTNKLLSVILALAVIISGIAVTMVTTNAADVAGMNATIYYMPTYGEILVEDSYGASVSFDNNTKFDATIEEMINSSYLVAEEPATNVSIHGDGDWFIQKWTGTMTPAVSGEVTLIGRKIDNGFVMFVDGVKVYEYWGASHWFDGAGDRLAYGTSFTVEAGQEYDVEIYYLELGGGNALEIFATTTPDNLDSGANINDVATYNLTMQKYVIGDNTGEFNNLVGSGATEEEGNAQCIADNWKHDASIEKILAKTREGESKVVASFSEPIFDKECYVIRYNGYIEPKVSGTYVFGATKVDNGFYLNIDGTVAYEFWAGNVWNDKGGNTYPNGIALEAGKKYPFTADFLETNGGQVLELVASVDGGAASSVNDLFNFYASVEEGEEGGEPVVTIDPYTTVKAGVDATEISVGTTYDGSEFGIEQNGGDNDGGVGTTYDGAWMKYANVAFGNNGAQSITINYISKATRMMEDAAAEIWIGGMEGAGTKVATVALPVPEDREADYTKLVATADLDTVVTGTQDLYIVLTGTCDDTQDNEYVANVTNFVFTEVESDDNTGDDNTGDDNTGDDNTGDDNTGDEEVVSNTKLSATDKEVLFYTDFSDVSDLVVRNTTVNNWPNHVDDDVVSDITLDADGNMVMSATQYIDLGVDLLKGQDEMIIEFVIKPDAIVNHAAFAGIGANLPNINEADWWVIGMRDDGAVKFGMKSNDIEAGAGDDGKSQGGLLKVGEWANIKYEITATTVKVYVNGTEVKSWDVTGQKTLSEMAEIENAEFIFGKEMRWGDAGFSGAIAEIRVTTTTAADSSTGSAGTGDIASVAALLLAGAAALGGLTLRKKSK